jgi:hypothetical protein
VRSGEKCENGSARFFSFNASIQYGAESKANRELQSVLSRQCFNANSRVVNTIPLSTCRSEQWSTPRPFDNFPPGKGSPPGGPQREAGLFRETTAFCRTPAPPHGSIRVRDTNPRAKRVTSSRSTSGNVVTIHDEIIITESLLRSCRGTRSSFIRFPVGRRQSGTGSDRNRSSGRSYVVPQG